MLHLVVSCLSALVVVLLITNNNRGNGLHAKQCKQSQSVYGYRLRNHVIRRSFESELYECVKRCQEQCYCRSINYRITNQLCELNYASQTSHSKDYERHNEFIYYENDPEILIYKSCMDIKTENSSAQSGYYNLVVKDRCLIAYCDMDNYEGGWTLVATISNKNIDHLQNSQHNCFNSSLCVTYSTNNVQSRKLADHEIHQLAANEGTFRVQVLHSDVGTYDVFYQIPSGAEHFNSSCAGEGRACPRIIVSYSPHPYVWESNCKGTSIGYYIYHSSCHRVFDGHDNEECGSRWHSSEISGKRVLYGYNCPSKDYKGIYANQNGMLFVR